MAFSSPLANLYTAFCCMFKLHYKLSCAFKKKKKRQISCSACIYNSFKNIYIFYTGWYSATQLINIDATLSFNLPHLLPELMG